MNLKFDEANKTGVLTGITGVLIVGLNYMSSIEWVWTDIDPDRALAWGSSIFAFVFYTNKENRKKPVGGEAVTIDTEDASLPIGLRINNPGNLRPSSRFRWNGTSDEPHSTYSTKSGDFVRFKSIDYGLRAMALNLKNQQRLHGLRTIEGIIGKYAPEIENDTASYIAFVANQTGFAASEKLNLENPSVTVRLMKAMIRMEQGQQPFSTELILKGVNAA